MSRKKHAPELLRILALAEKLASSYTTDTPSAHLTGERIEACATAFAGAPSPKRLEAQWLELVEALHDARIAKISAGESA